jgi:hypothetical protein
MGLMHVIGKAAGLSLAISSIAFPAAVAGKPCIGGKYPTVISPQGQIRGFRDSSGSAVYLGVPFAATTGGENR